MKSGGSKKEEFFCSSFAHWISDIKDKNYIKTTDFLSLPEQSAALELLRAEVALKSRLFGGFKTFERAQLAVCPASFEISKEDFPCLCVKASVRDKRALSGRALPAHRDYLGSVLALGIKREKVGDIIVSGPAAFLAVHSEIAGFLKEELRMAASFAVDAEILPGFDGIGRGERVIKSTTVASERLDAVVAAILRESREKSAVLVAGEKVFLGGRLQKSLHASVGPGDVLSVRGYGKFKIQEIERLTKKNRRVLVFEIYT